VEAIAPCARRKSLAYTKLEPIISRNTPSSALRADQEARRLHHHRGRPHQWGGLNFNRFGGPNRLDDLLRLGTMGLWHAGRDRVQRAHPDAALHRHRRRTSVLINRAEMSDRRQHRLARSGLHHHTSNVWGGNAGIAAWRPLFRKYNGALPDFVSSPEPITRSASAARTRPTSTASIREMISRQAGDLRRVVEPAGIGSRCSLGRAHNENAAGVCCGQYREWRSTGKVK